MDVEHALAEKPPLRGYAQVGPPVRVVTWPSAAPSASSPTPQYPCEAATRRTQATTGEMMAAMVLSTFNFGDSQGATTSAGDESSRSGGYLSTPRPIIVRSPNRSSGATARLTGSGRVTTIPATHGLKRQCEDEHLDGQASKGARTANSMFSMPHYRDGPNHCYFSHPASGASSPASEVVAQHAASAPQGASFLRPACVPSSPSVVLQSQSTSRAYSLPMQKRSTSLAPPSSLNPHGIAQQESAQHSELLKARDTWRKLIALIPEKMPRRGWLPPYELFISAIEQGILPSTALNLKQSHAVCLTERSRGGGRNQCETFIALLRAVGSSFINSVDESVGSPSPAPLVRINSGSPFPDTAPCGLAMGEDPVKYAHSSFGRLYPPSPLVLHMREAGSHALPIPATGTTAAAPVAAYAFASAPSIAASRVSHVWRNRRTDGAHVCKLALRLRRCPHRLTLTPFLHTWRARRS